MSYDVVLSRSASSALDPRIRIELETDPAIAKCDILFYSQDEGHPDEVDLRFALEGGDIDIRAFEEFCKANGLAVDPENPQSARHFLESLWGNDVAVVSLRPNAEVAAAALAALRKIAKNFQLRLFDPQLGSSLDLDGDSLPPTF